MIYFNIYPNKTRSQEGRFNPIVEIDTIDSSQRSELSAERPRLAVFWGPIDQIIGGRYSVRTFTGDDFDAFPEDWPGLYIDSNKFTELYWNPNIISLPDGTRIIDNSQLPLILTLRKPLKKSTEPVEPLTIRVYSIIKLPIPPEVPVRRNASLVEEHLLTHLQPNLLLRFKKDMFRGRIEVNLQPRDDTSPK